MKAITITALALSLMMTALPAGTAVAAKAGGAKAAAKGTGLTPGAAAVTNKAAKAAAGAKQPLTVQIEKVEGQTLTVMTQPMMGPDGLIAAKEKQYDATNATTVTLNGDATKKLSDLIAGGTARITITDDGKTVEQVTEQYVTPADRQAKRAAKKAGAAGGLPVVPPAPQVP